ncbi:MAG: hypothetical protein HQM12_08425 [SAR324 cluster bacterium]|nr:hypothetical protein [SAR324 cluster bacterium]
MRVQRTINLNKNPGIFEPLKLPESLELVLEKNEAELVEKGIVDFTAELVPGLYEMPLSTGMPCVIRIEENCTLNGHVEINTAEPTGESVITNLRVKITPPLGLENIVVALREINHVFRDKQLQEFIGHLLAQLPWMKNPVMATTMKSMIRKFLKNAPDSENLTDDMDQLATMLAEKAEHLATVKLSEIQAKNVWKKREHHLQFKFTGMIRYFDAISFPFIKFLLPSAVLPTLHASLEKLLSSNPLASANMLTQNVPTHDLAQKIADTLAGLNASFSMRGYLPLITTRMELILNSILSCNVEGRDWMELQGSMKLQRQNDYFNFSARADVSSRGNVPKPCDMSGKIHPGALIAKIWEKPEFAREWPAPVSEFKMQLSQGFTLSPLRMEAQLRHPAITGQIILPLYIPSMELKGSGNMTIPPDWNPTSPDGQFAFSGSMNTASPATLESSQILWENTIHHGKFEGHAQWTSKKLNLELEASGELQLTGKTFIASIPELMIDDPLEHWIDARFVLKLKAELDSAAPVPRLLIKNSSIHLETSDCRMVIGEKRIEWPEKMSFEGEVSEGDLDISGLGKTNIGIQWNMHGKSPVLVSSLGRSDLFISRKRQGHLQLQVNDLGYFTLNGDDSGVFNAKLLNDLLNPQKDGSKLMDVINSDKAVNHVLGLLKHFSESWAERLGTLHRHYQKYRRILEKDDINDPKDLIPNEDMARILSKFLSNDERWFEQLRVILKQVTDGRGMDRPALKRIISEVYPDHPYDYEVDRILRWVGDILKPEEALPPPELARIPPLVLDNQYKSFLKGLPGARKIYAVIAGKREMPEHFHAKLASLAPYLTMEQISYILNSLKEGWREEELFRMKKVLAIKKRIRLIGEGVGDVRYAFLPVVVSFFLRDVLKLQPASNIPVPAGETEQIYTNTLSHMLGGTTLLGPKEVAVLLRTGLAWPWQSLVVQLNQHLLVNYILSCPPGFFQEILVELSENSTKILTSTLMSLIKQDDQHVVEPSDYQRLFRRLGIVLPELKDFMSGGKHAGDSYYEAVSNVAEQILAKAPPYLARKNHLQVHLHSLPGPLKIKTSSKPQMDTARKTIEHADQIGLKWMNHEAGKSEAQEAYEHAFKTCASLLKHEPYVITLPWFKQFWQRNYEALVVLSVLKNYQQDIEKVRNWLHVRSKKTEFENESALLDTIIEVLYYFPEEQGHLKSDPLVRLLIDPPPGKYDFTIISCMGLITEGSKGTELSPVYKRLLDQRGIRTVRANTGTLRTLEHNAQEIEQVIRKIKTPWGFLGYSQGCANSLTTESMLLGGTPEQQKLLKGLRCRNLMFGAHNGSAHGSCGHEKIRHAMIKGERFFKRYQGLYSSWVTDSYFRILKLILDSRMFVQLIGGAESVSHEVCLAMARDGQFLGLVPTSTIRGVVFPEILPEACEFLSNLLTVQTGGALHDTQVTLVSTRGFSNRVRNEYTQVLENCDMGSYPQSSHHWSPLVKEVEFVTTPRDYELAIYDFPLDRHVFPWIEVNARFGNIERK